MLLLLLKLRNEISNVFRIYLELLSLKKSSQSDFFLALQVHHLMQSQLGSLKEFDAIKIFFQFLQKWYSRQNC